MAIGTPEDNRELNQNFRDFINATRDVKQKDTKELKQLLNDAKRTSEAFAGGRVGMNLLTSSQRKYREAQDDVRANLNQVNHVLDQYRKGLQSLTTDEKKKLLAERRRLEAMTTSDTANSRFVGIVVQLGSAVQNIGSVLIAGQTAVAAAIQGGSSGFGIALAKLTADANTQLAVTQVTTGAMSSAGQALMGFGLAGQVAGGAMVAFAQYRSVTANLETQAQNARNQMILGGGDAILKSFMEATKSGAVLAGGFGQIRQSLEGSNFVIEDFTAIVKDNQRQLAGANLGVADASMFIGRVGKVMKDTKMDRQLLALGYSYQEQGGLMAQVMADMRRTDPQAALNDKEIAVRTKQYAIDLTALSSITGKNAKQLMEESRKKTGQLAFQQFLSTLGPRAAQVEQAFASLPAQIQQNVMDMVNYGSVINKQGAVMSSLFPAQDAMQRELLASVMSGSATTEQFTKIQGRFAGQLNSEIMGNREFALAAAAPGSKLEAMGTAAAEARTHINSMAGAAAAFAAARTLTDKVGGGKEDGQTKLFLDMVELGQEIRKKFQEHILNNLEAMGPLLKKVLNSIDATVPKAPSFRSVMEKLINDVITEITNIWNQSPLWAKVLMGAGALVAALAALSGAAAYAAKLWYGIKTLGGLGSRETMPGQTDNRPGNSREQQREREQRRNQGPTRGRGSIPGLDLPNRGPGGPAPTVPNAPGLGPFSQGIVNILKALGTGAGELIAGVMRGISLGIQAFANPKVLVGAGIFAGALVIIGGAIYLNGRMLTSLLPDLSAALAKVQALDGDRLSAVGKGMMVVGGGLAVFTSTGMLSTLSNGLSSLGDGIVRFFGGKTTIEKFQEFAKVGPALAAGAEGISKFNTSMQALMKLDVSKISALAEAQSKLVDASMGAGFFKTLGSASAGALMSNDFLAKLIAKAQGGVATGAESGQTVFSGGAAVVHLSTATIAALKGTAVASIASVPAARADISTSSLKTMSKTDPVLFALQSLLDLEVTRQQGQNKDKFSKSEIELALLTDIAEATAKTASFSSDTVKFARKNLLMVK